MRISTKINNILTIYPDRKIRQNVLLFLKHFQKLNNSLGEFYPKN